MLFPLLPKPLVDVLIRISEESLPLLKPVFKVTNVRSAPGFLPCCFVLLYWVLQFAHSVLLIILEFPLVVILVRVVVFPFSATDSIDEVAFVAIPVWVTSNTKSAVFR